MELNAFSAIIALIILGIGTVIYLKRNKPSKDEIVDQLKEPLLLLFLYAEKKGWSGPDKMKWCLSQVLSIVPVKIDEATLEGIAQKLYDEYRSAIKETLE